MTTLVVASSQHGSTREIAERVAGVLHKNKGVGVTVKDPKDATPWVQGATAVLVALPVYRGSLDAAGKKFLDAHRAELTGKPLFILASGGAPELDHELRLILESYHPKEIGYFRGALVEDKLGFLEKLQIRLAKGEYGDFRDWPAIEAWGKSLGHRGAS